MRDEHRESFTLLPRRSDLWAWIAKPGESRLKKLIGGRNGTTGTLSVTGPTKNKVR
jgi:hypothetical protein